MQRIQPWSSRSISVFLLALAAICQISPDAEAFQRRDSTTPHQSGKAFVVDDRLSALRRAPALKSTVIRRLHLGRKVWIVGKRSETANEPAFYRVAISRRTSGWIHSGALSIPGRRGEDLRLIGLITNSNDSFDRLGLCRIFLDNFSRSPKITTALFEFGSEAERAAKALTSRSNRRLGKMESQAREASVRDYYLSDPALDRYSRLGVRFEFDKTESEYVYEGKAYREILIKHSRSELAGPAREKLEAIEARLRRQP
jgi:hypothetical protein